MARTGGRNRCRLCRLPVSRYASETGRRLTAWAGSDPFHDLRDVTVLVPWFAPVLIENVILS